MNRQAEKVGKAVGLGSFEDCHTVIGVVIPEWVLPLCHSVAVVLNQAPVWQTCTSALCAIAHPFPEINHLFYIRYCTGGGEALKRLPTVQCHDRFSSGVICYVVTKINNKLLAFSQESTSMAQTNLSLEAILQMMHCACKCHTLQRCCSSKGTKLDSVGNATTSLGSRFVSIYRYIVK